jgi:hypothetical protein
MPRNPWVKSPTPESDTHLYIDMSGWLGMNPAEWIVVVASEVERLKSLAQELGKPVILRLTAFSHELADDATPIEVTASYPSDEELAELIRAMPKAQGGTEFPLVWDRINTSATRGARHNVIVSDLEWWGATETVSRSHPVHLHYIAVASTRPATKQHFITILEKADLPEEHRIS